MSLSKGSLLTSGGLYSQQDSEATSEWIWVDTPANIKANGWIYVYFIVDPVTLLLTAKNSQTGHNVLQVCNFKGTTTPYLNLAAKAGLPEQVTGEPCEPIVLRALPL